VRGSTAYTRSEASGLLRSFPCKHRGVLMMGGLRSSAWWQTVCHDFLSFNMFTAAELQTAFAGEIRAFKCTGCSRFLLKQWAKMSDWRVGALQIQAGSVAHALAQLPIPPCKRKMGLDDEGRPRGLCDSFQKRAARRLSPARIPSCTPRPPPTPPTLHAVGDVNNESAIGAISLRPPTLQPRRTSSGDISSTSRTVGGGVCTHCSSALLSAYLSRQRAAAAALQLVNERERVARLTADLAAARARSAHAMCAPPTAVDGSPVLLLAGSSSSSDRCQAFLRDLRSARVDREADKILRTNISSALLLPGAGRDIRLTHHNSVVSVYSKRASPRRILVRKSQANKRLAAWCREGGACGSRTASEAPAVARDVAQRTNQRDRLVGRGTTGPARLSVEGQVGLIFLNGVSFVAWNKIRLAFCEQRSGMASLSVLCRARRVKSERPSKQVVVDSTGAHLTSLSDAVQENVFSLVGSDDWVERYLYGASLRPVEKIGGFDASPPGKPGGSPVASTPEVQVSLGLDKGGSPSSVKIVEGILNQAHPNNPAHTILVAFCPTEKDKYQDLVAMLERHLPDLDRLIR